MSAIGGDHHAPARNFELDLLGAEVRLALGDPLHFRRHDAQPGHFELGNRLESLGCLPLARFEAPVLGHEVPRRLVRGGRHAGRIGRAEAQGAADVGWVGEAAWRSSSPWLDAFPPTVGYRTAARWLTPFGEACWLSLEAS